MYLIDFTIYPTTIIDHRSISFCLTFFLQHLDSPIVFVIFIIVTTLFPPAGASKGNPPPSFMHDHLYYSYYSYIHASIAGQLSSFPLHGRISNKLGRIKLPEDSVRVGASVVKGLVRGGVTGRCESD